MIRSGAGMTDLAMTHRALPQKQAVRVGVSKSWMLKNNQAV